MTKLPKVSIILPTYNGSRFIETAIKSVMKQSYEDFELLTIDDGSTDNVAEVISRFSERDPRIIHLRNEKNLGIQKSLNKGLREAKGEYIARIDDDDEWIDKDKLKKQVGFLDAHPDYVLVGTGAIVINEDGQELFRIIEPETDFEIRNKILYKICFVHSSIMFKKKATMKFGGYDESEDTRGCEDTDLWFKLGIIGNFTNLQTISVKRMYRTGSIASTHGNKIKRFRKEIRLIKTYRKYYPNYWQALLRAFLRLIIYRLLGFSFLVVLKNKLKRSVTKN
jgi:glycosyltransferase involved in cell wall biosynthesis